MKRGNTKHGLCYEPEYNVWSKMKQRCTKPSESRYDRYGGRGISVCKEWMESFEQFYKDMGPRPSHHHSIDRINNDGNYEPSNCRWADFKTQANNKSINRFLTHNGETRTMSQWASFIGISYNVLTARLDLGWSVDDALTKPTYERRVKGYGVTKDYTSLGRLRWKAYAYENNKRKHLGSFDTEAEARKARMDYESQKKHANG